MKLRGGEFSTGTRGNFQPELTDSENLRNPSCALGNWPTACTLEWLAGAGRKYHSLLTSQSMEAQPTIINPVNTLIEGRKSTVYGGPSRAAGDKTGVVAAQTE